MTEKHVPTLEDLIEELKEEGSLQEYYRYLFDRYGSRMTGNMYGYSMQYPEGTPEQKGHTSHLTKGFIDSATQKYVDPPEEVKICEDFLRDTMEADLVKKPLGILFWIAESEKDYNPHPFFRAIDIYYKLNLRPGATKGEVQEITRDFEDMVSFDQWEQ